MPNASSKDLLRRCAVPLLALLLGGFMALLTTLSLFWFDIRRENLERVRRSDLLIFRLGQHLRHRLVGNPAARLDSPSDIL